MCSGKTCWSHSLFCVNFCEKTTQLDWLGSSKSFLTPAPSCFLHAVLLAVSWSPRCWAWDRTCLENDQGNNWHGSLAGEKNRCLDLTIAPQNRDLYQTLGAHNRTTKSSNFGDSKQDFICDMFCFIQHGLTRVWLCFIPQDDRSLLGFCVFSFLLTHFTFGVCNLISKFGVAIAFYLKWWCLEMVVCIAHANHRTSWKLQVAVHNETDWGKWSTHLLKVRRVTNGGAGLKLIQPKNQGSVSLDPEVIGHRQSKMSLKLGCIWRLSISSPQCPILIHCASLLWRCESIHVKDYQ